MFVVTQSWLSDFDQAELLLPLLLDELQQLGGEPAVRDDRARLAVGRFHDVAVADQITGAQLRQPRLARAEEVSGAAQLEIALRDGEAVTG